MEYLVCISRMTFYAKAKITNGIVRRVYRPTLLPQKFRKDNHDVSYLRKIFKENLLKNLEKKFKCKTNKMQQWLKLQQVGSL
jgi:hypothetical protein